MDKSEVDFAGKTAHILKTEYNGKPIYIIALEEELNCELKVIQPETKSDLKSRFEVLEKKLNKHLESEDKDNKNSGFVEIRIQNLRRVKPSFNQCTHYMPPFSSCLSSVKHLVSNLSKQDSLQDIRVKKA